MIYSVWNQGTNAFDYYEGPSVQKTLNTPVPNHIPHKDLGATIEQSSWPLPSSARKVGSGEMAKGRVASKRGGFGPSLGDFSMDTNTVGLIGFGLAAFLLWRSGFLKA